MDCGSGFSVTANSYYDDSMFVHWDASTPTIRRSYDGWVNARQEGAIPGSIIWPVVTPPSYAQRIAMGSTAISRVLPKNPVSNCFVSTREIVKDGVPAIPFLRTLKDKASHFQKLKKLGGQEYLNVEFGWLPFVSDLHNLARAAANSHSILSQYERDAGRNIRRRYNFPLIATDVTTSSTGSTSPSLSVQTNPGYGIWPLETRKLRSTETWFSGCFTYWLRRPDSLIGSMSRIAQEANKLLGVEPTPDNVWKSQPWTWGIDWFSNVGDVLHNISALQDDSQVMRYGYIMSHSVAEDTYTLRVQSKLGRDLVQMFGTYVKQREKATPYGFGSDPTGWSASRLAIVAALGISLIPGGK